MSGKIFDLSDISKEALEHMSESGKIKEFIENEELSPGPTCLTLRDVAFYVRDMDDFIRRDGIEEHLTECEYCSSMVMLIRAELREIGEIQEFDKQSAFVLMLGLFKAVKSEEARYGKGEF